MDFLVGAAAILALDSVYLGVSKTSWRKMISDIQGSDLEVRLLPAIGVYILMSFALHYFVIRQSRTIYDAALLGFIIYGVFDLTNAALFKKYKFLPALVDMAWGAVLFGLSAYTVKTIFNL
jgi:uncharacterized membrane protein